MNVEFAGLEAKRISFTVHHVVVVIQRLWRVHIGAWRKQCIIIVLFVVSIYLIQQGKSVYCLVDMQCIWNVLNRWSSIIAFFSQLMSKTLQVCMPYLLEVNVWYVYCLEEVRWRGCFNTIAWRVSKDGANSLQWLWGYFWSPVPCFGTQMPKLLLLQHKVGVMSSWKFKYTNCQTVQDWKEFHWNS